MVHHTHKYTEQAILMFELELENQIQTIKFITLHLMAGSCSKKKQKDHIIKEEILNHYHHHGQLSFATIFVLYISYICTIHKNTMTMKTSSTHTHCVNESD